MFSIIIPSYNRKEPTERLVKLLLEQKKSKNLDFEIVVVDYNNSFIFDYHDEVVVVSVTDFPYTGKPFSLSHARNIGANSAKFDWLVFLDCDLKPHNKAVILINEAIKRANENQLYYATRVKLTQQLSVISNITQPWGYCIILHKNAFVKLNGFNEAINGWGDEDTEFCERVRELDLELKPINGCIFYHPWHQEETWNVSKKERFPVIDKIKVDQVTEFQLDRIKYLNKISELEKQISLHSETVKSYTDQINAYNEKINNIESERRNLADNVSICNTEKGELGVKLHEKMLETKELSKKLEELAKIIESKSLTIKQLDDKLKVSSQKSNIVIKKAKKSIWTMPISELFKRKK